MGPVCHSPLQIGKTWCQGPTEHAEDDERNWHVCRVFSLAVVFKKQPKKQADYQETHFLHKIGFQQPMASKCTGPIRAPWRLSK